MFIQENTSEEWPERVLESLNCAMKSEVTRQKFGLINLFKTINSALPDHQVKHPTTQALHDLIKSSKLREYLFNLTISNQTAKSDGFSMF
jgi:hypothetical protein